MDPTTEIKTFVFFDLESTGLPELEFFKTKITELSFVACSKDHLIECYSSLNKTIKSLSHIPDHRKLIPRVLHKQTLCFNPQKRITDKSEAITGLCNFKLEHENKFNENAGQLLKHFIEHLQQPACLVAHNGLKFDFILLRKQLMSLNIELPGNLLCIDSLDAFKAIDVLIEVNAKKENEDNELIKLEKKTLDVLEELEKSDARMKETQRINETTPQRKKDTPEEAPSSSMFQFKSRKRLSYDIQSSQSPSTQSSPTKKKYALNNIYERSYNVLPPVSHRAEDDCNTLLQCVITCGEEFVKYAEMNAIPFSTIKSNF